MNKEELLAKKKQLEDELWEIEEKITILNNMDKPYVANVHAYSGHYSMQFKTEEKARKKLNEYYSKDYFKNGLNYGVYLYKYNEDGSRTLLEVKPKGKKDYYPPSF